MSISPPAIDGPFAETETKELIAGYSMIEVKSREEAPELREAEERPRAQVAGKK